MSQQPPDPKPVVAADEIDELIRAVNALAKQTAAARLSYRKLRAMVVGLVVGLVLGVSGVVGLAFVAAHQQRNSERITEVQQRTSNRVLCPLYKTLLSFETRSTTAPNLTATEKKDRTDAYAVIHDGYAVLECAP
jgi:hypothetical protein